MCSESKANEWLEGDHDERMLDAEAKFNHTHKCGYSQSHTHSSLR